MIVHRFIPQSFHHDEEPASADISAERSNFLERCRAVMSHPKFILDETMIRVTNDSENKLLFEVISPEHARCFYEFYKSSQFPFTPVEDLPDPGKFNLDESLWDAIERLSADDDMDKILNCCETQDDIISYISTKVRSINAFDGNHPSIFFTLLVKYMKLGLNESHISELLSHSSPYVRALGIVISRYVFSPENIDKTLISYVAGLLKDGIHQCNISACMEVCIMKGETIHLTRLIEKLIYEDEFLEAWFPIYSPADHFVLKENFERAVTERSSLLEDNANPTLPYGFVCAQSLFKYISLPILNDTQELEEGKEHMHTKLKRTNSAKYNEKKVCPPKNDLDFEEVPYL